MYSGRDPQIINLEATSFLVNTGLYATPLKHVDVENIAKFSYRDVGVGVEDSLPQFWWR